LGSGGGGGEVIEGTTKLRLLQSAPKEHGVKQAQPYTPIRFSEPSKHWHVYPVPLVMQVPSPHQTILQGVGGGGRAIGGGGGGDPLPHCKSTVQLGSTQDGKVKVPICIFFQPGLHSQSKPSNEASEALHTP